MARWRPIPVAADLENKAPEFKDANENVITSDIRSIAEGAVTDAELRLRNVRQPIRNRH